MGFSVGTDLRSATQRLKIDTKGEYVLPDQLNATVNLSEIRLVLPDFEPRTPPKFVPDSRFQDLRGTRELAQKKSDFKYDVKITTTQGHPVQLVHSISKHTIPLYINLAMKENVPATGKIHVDDFQLQLFRRDARVDYFEIIAATRQTDTEVKGKVDFHYTDYTIHLYVDGLLDRPRTRLLSDPPLPEKQVIAVLLFGKPIEELDSDQVNSVGNTRSAIVDGALTLASMYALASTPVESVGYDPGTKMFSAKLRLADGTSFNLKSDTSQVRQLGIRKRLGPNWGINTYLEDPFEAAKRSLTTLLEWNFLF